MADLFRRFLRACFVALLAIAACFVVSTDAYAEERSGDELPDVMLAVFTNSENDGTDSIYMSYDGMHFERIAEAFVDTEPNNPNKNIAVGSGSPANPVPTPNGWERKYEMYTHKCPSIIYHNGYFWMLSNSGWSQNGMLELDISNSKDLVHWCDPRRVMVPVEAGWTSNGTPGQFDAVAADWAVGPDGNVYAVVSIGRYGAFHEQAENDTMFPYLVKFNELSGHNDPVYNPIGNDENYITVSTEAAKPIVLPTASANRIDGSLYVESGTTYLSIKENGVRNEIWSINDLGRVWDPSAWILVNSNVVTGFEAPSLTKLNGNYYMFTDELANWTPDDHVRQPFYSTGTHMQMSSNLGWGWSSPQRIDAYKSDYSRMSLGEHGNPNGDGPRHGTVITVTDPAAKEAIWAARAASGWRADQYPPSYVDQDPQQWYAGAIDCVTRKGIMTGYGNGVFGIDASLERGQIATMLWRIADPANAFSDAKYPNETGMDDVASYDYYTGAANWAVKNGVINGENGLFNPHGIVTREMLAKMIANYVHADLGSVDRTKFDSMVDASLTSSWAVDEMAWAVDEGVFNGSNGVLNPTGAITRAEAAMVFTNAMNLGIL